MHNDLFSFEFAEFLLLLVALLAILVVYRRRGPSLAERYNHRLPDPIRVKHIVLGISTLILITGFLQIAGEVREHETRALDTGFTSVLKDAGSPAFEAVMKFFTVIGDFIPVIVILLLMIAWALRRGDRRAAITMAAISAFEGGLNVLLKSLYERQRPDIINRIAELHSYSFPSGHAMGAVVVFGTIALVLTRWFPRAEPLINTVAVLWILAIGFSRVYLGVHWLTDIAAGFMMGAALVAMAAVFLPIHDLPGHEKRADR